MHKEIEKFKVYLDIRHGEVVCCCKKTRKLCDKDCQEYVVQLNKFLDWEDTFRRDRYGR